TAHRGHAGGRTATEVTKAHAAEAWVATANRGASTGLTTTGLTTTGLTATGLTTTGLTTTAAAANREARRRAAEWPAAQHATCTEVAAAADDAGTTETTKALAEALAQTKPLAGVTGGSFTGHSLRCHVGLRRRCSLCSCRREPRAEALTKASIGTALRSAPSAALVGRGIRRRRVLEKLTSARRAAEAAARII